MTRGTSSKHRDWTRVRREKDQYYLEKKDERHNREVEKFLKSREKRTGKRIERDWND
jgi:hypothetical protein